MGKKRRKNLAGSGLTANAAAIISSRGWNVSVFNGGSHLRINGVVDVWPTRKRWMPTNHSPNQFAENYRDLNHLRDIVRQHESQATKAQRSGTRASQWFASLPEGDAAAAKPEVRGVPTWEDFSRRFDNRPGQQAKLFNPGPKQKQAVRPSRDPLAAHNARKIEDWGPEFVPDPNFERPPWE